MANEYATISELKATLNLTNETYADADITLALSTASRGIDQVCGRRFYADTGTANERFYTPEDACRLQVDDLITVTSVETDPGGDGTFEDAWTLNTDYLLEPLNAAADGEPWTEILAHPNGSYRFSCLPRSVKVTGKFGWAATPDGVKQATMILATKLMRRVREAPFGVVTIGFDGAPFRIAKSDPDIMFLLGDYIRDRVAVA